VGDHLIRLLNQREDQTMHNTISRIRLPDWDLSALLATGSMAVAETVQLKADLKGSFRCHRQRGRDL
jgi:hypothetical protein